MNKLSEKNTRILIGFLSKTIKGSIPIITNTYYEELKYKYNIIPFYMERKKGKENLSSLNISNIFYFIKHYLDWCCTIIIRRPKIAHFPITSFWNLEKSLLFLTTAKVLGVKHTIGHLHGGAFIDFWKQVSSPRRYLALKQLKKLDVFIVLSESWKLNVIKYVGIEERKIKILYNLIDREFESHFRNYERDYGDKGKVTFLGFNIMDSRKGLFDLLEAVNLINNKTSFGVILIGDERESGIFEKTNKIIQEKGLININMISGVWSAEKIKWFENTDVLILPSYIENFPVVVLEAACAGIPVIASRIGALPDIFTHDKDILFIDSGNIRQLIGFMERLIFNNNERKRIGENIKNTFNRELTGIKIIDQLDAIYEELL